ncbi:LDH2 family malate/lactate/ureidoglycolate dehydrogenase [Actinomadura pelletieri DSM 43383]|uniref:LDH2 family malate/lactate/ureidoglycolate dehydrogenase n=1 Tax=Actinomadura pelletieri DSM 43383 TaxID=1120940 RepID=A0A495QG71_9ACTN|nr:Ldh family oxidoreductase [Actinomadura pelletieri]RKS70912.1 LDH2 family malate/lactate/ureidoglycolate dehydrogenase [Actinomadura pelletieri DSM 43383]
MPVRISADELRDAATRIFIACGVPSGDALLVADSLVQADLWGHQSHGVLRVGWYVDRIRAGVMTGQTKAEIVSGTGAVATLDGRDGIGQVITAQAAREAVDRAGRHGVGVVAVRNSNHFGTAAYFTRMAPPRGCIGILTTNSSPAMAPWGGRGKLVGSNPWSIAAPLGGDRQFVLDIANTAVARGKIYLARNRGEEIPDGWAVDADGTPTRDPEAALLGAVLPMAGHKGYGISVMMDVLSGVLSASGFGSAVNGPYQSEKPGRSGHLYMALDIASFSPVPEFEERMSALVAELKAGSREGEDEVRYPGEIEDLAEARNAREGLLLPERTVADLRRVAHDLGVDVLEGR